MVSYSTLTDDQLFACLRDSEQGALTEIYDRYWNKLLAISINLLKDQEEAQDCVQDVFIKLWSSRESISIKSNLQSYLATMVRFKVYDIFDKRHRIKAKITAARPVEEMQLSPSAEELLFEKELNEKLKLILNSLPQRTQAVFVKSRMEGKTNKEIADELNVTIKAVEYQIQKVTKDLRDNLSTNLPTSIIMWALINELHHKL